MKLYKLEASNHDSFFGIPREKGGEPIERDMIRVAQTPSCDAFLYLSKTTYDELELLDSVPTEGFDFTYCQEWGLEVTEAKIDRAIADIPSRYPEMVA